MGKLNIQGDLDIYNYLSASNTDLYLSSASSDYPIRFRIGTTEVARISPAGCLNINSTQTSDAYKLYVSGKSYFADAVYLKSTIWVNNSTIGGQIAFLPARSTDDKPTGVINYYACGSTSATDYNLGAFYFTQYSYTDGTYNRLEYWDRYAFPLVAAGKTENNTYTILTTKKTITVAQGGTNATTAKGAEYNIILNGNTASSTSAITDTTQFVFKLVTPSATEGVLYYRTADYLWTYIKGKSDSRFLKLSGGTITGSLNFSTANQYYSLSDHTGGAIRLNNGDIGGVNSIYFKDACSVGEGLHFYVSSTTVDTLRATDGVLYFDKTYDIEAGTAAATYTVIHSGNYTSYQVDSKVTQKASTSTSWRPILLHYTYTSQGTDPGTATNQVYYNAKASIQPSTGKIYSAGGFIGNATSATTAGGINSVSPVLAVAGESNVLQAINNYDYYTNDTPIKHSLLAMVKALDFQWYTSHWRIGNLRSGSTASSGFGFAFSADNSTWNLRAFVEVDGYLWANKLGSYNYGSTLPSSGQKGEIFFKT